MTLLPAVVASLGCAQCGVADARESRPSSQSNPAPASPGAC
jgi:hypothetical protein